MKVEKYSRKLNGCEDSTLSYLRFEMPNPGPIAIGMEVQADKNLDAGIIRHAGVPHILRNGYRVYGAEAMREDTLDIKEHTKHFMERHPSAWVIAAIGLGNVLQNPWFLLWRDGDLYCLASELEHLADRTYTCLCVWHEGHITTENLQFEYGKATQVKKAGGSRVTDELICATFGQQIIRDGQPVDFLDISEQTYDKRHLFLLPYYEPIGYHFGIDQLILDEEKSQTALKGVPIELNLKMRTSYNEFAEVDLSELKRALAFSEYTEVQHTHPTPGEYHIRKKKLLICLKKGIYPHNAIALSDDRLTVHQVMGRSSRVGISIDAFANLLLEEGAQQALLLDNGSDVFFWWQGTSLRAQQQAPRTRLRAILLFFCNSKQTMLPRGLKLYCETI